RAGLTAHSALYSYRHTMNSEQPVEPVGGDVESVTITEIQFRAAVRPEFALGFVDALDMGIMSDRAVSQSGTQAAGNPFRGRSRFDDPGIGQKLPLFVIRELRYGGVGYNPSAPRLFVLRGERVQIGKQCRRQNQTKSCTLH